MLAIYNMCIQKSKIKNTAILTALVLDNLK